MENWKDSHFLHEKEAFELIDKALSQVSGIRLFFNYELPFITQRSFHECDLILLTKYFIEVVELKSWSGTIVISADKQWKKNQRFEQNPHETNNFKCKLLKGYIERNCSSVIGKIPFINSVVVLTKNDAIVENYDHYDWKRNLDTKKYVCFSFKSTTDFIQHVKSRLGYAAQNEKPLLSDNDLENISNTLALNRNRESSYRYQIPGYEIISNRTKNELYSEFIAKSYSGLDKRLKRIRVFGEPSTNITLLERQKRTVDLINKLGPHPNIHQVFLLPHDKGLIIEVSEWSDKETLLEVLKTKDKLNLKVACSFIYDILIGLEFIHKNEIIHRALSPTSILISANRAQIMDFDFAFDATSDTTVMTDHYRTIKSIYKAPEIYQGNADTKSDIFSLGVIFLEMLMGTKSLNEMFIDNVINKESLEKVLNEPIFIECRGIVKEVILCCLENNFNLRPDATTLIQEIVPYLTEKINRFGSANEELKHNARFNTWEIKELIGKSSTAQVYLATKGIEKVALKVFNIDISPEICKRELSIIKKVMSPYIVKGQTYFQWRDGRYCLEMDFVEGFTLKEQIKECKRPSIDSFRQCAIDLMDALIELHDDNTDDYKNTVVHCDINPNNIILSKVGPILIDFGLAGTPGIRQLCGTMDYIAPDLIHESDVEQSPNGDLFSLSLTLYEWLTGINPFSKQKRMQFDLTLEIPDSIPFELQKWFKKALSLNREERFQNASQMKDYFENVWTNSLSTVAPNDLEGINGTEIENCDIDEGETKLDSQSNLHDVKTEKSNIKSNLYNDDFVRYLNTLHNASANNSNAIAESQATSEHFRKIFVSLDELTNNIVNKLKSENGCNIILTGHAGDGKSTIALQVYRILHGIDIKEKLDQPIQNIESLRVFDKTIKIVKDISEFSVTERVNILNQAYNSTDNWLIVTNTGPLVDTFINLFSSKAYKLEDEILTILEKPYDVNIGEPYKISCLQKPTFIVNLTIKENISLAIDIIRQIINLDNWDKCSRCNIPDHCHIYENIKLLRNSTTILKRLELLYRRIADYGYKLTIRQLTAHISFFITSGIDCNDIRLFNYSDDDYLLNKSVINTIFGFQGLEQDINATNIKVVKLINQLSIGLFHFPIRKGIKINFTDPHFHFEEILRTQLENNSVLNRENVSKYDRMKRRIIYLLAESMPQLNNFLNIFLNTASLLDVDKLISAQNDEENNIFRSLEKIKKDTLEVLLELYTGIVSAKSSRGYLYITLKRDLSLHYQSSQIVLAKIRFENFMLALDAHTRTLHLKFKSQDKETSMPINLPLLDYIYKRKKGELSDELDSIFINQLESFKNELLNLADFEQDRGIEIIQSTLAGDLRKLTFRINNNKLEVNNAE